MKPSEFLEAQEGRRLRSYLDSAGVWTIGIGSTRYQDGRHVGPHETITNKQADALMFWDLGNKMPAIQKLLGKTVLNARQMTALISFTYNEGVGALTTSTLLKKVKVNPSDPSIRAEFMRWDKKHVDGKLVVDRGLTARREREANLYFS